MMMMMMMMMMMFLFFVFVFNLGLLVRFLVGFSIVYGITDHA